MTGETEATDLPLTALSARTVTVEEFQSAQKAWQEHLIPNTSGVYLWTFNFSALISESGLVIQEELGKLSQRTRAPRSTLLKPYYEIQISDHRMPMNDARRRVLRDALHAGDALGLWIAEMATLFQRPLYVGKARKLRSRICQHLGGASDLRLRFLDAGIDMLLLAVTWIELPAGYAPALADDEPYAIEDELPDEAERESEDEETDASGSSDLEDVLKAAESLLIRLSMPMFNEVQT